MLLGQVLDVLLDPKVPDERVRAAIWARIAPEQLCEAASMVEKIARPIDDSHLAQLADRYRHVRSFAPRVLAALRLRANPAGEAVLEAVEVLRELNGTAIRRVPDDAPLGFVPRSWRPYVEGRDGEIDRRHWELCLLSRLRDALRAGDVWVEGSRRHANPETFLISRATWNTQRHEAAPDLELRAAQASAWMRWKPILASAWVNWIASFAVAPR